MGNNRIKLNKKWTKRLTNIYYNPKHIAGFSNVKILHTVTGIPYNYVRQFLQSQDTYTVHKKRIKNKTFNNYHYHGIFHTWQADLCDLSSLKSHNKGHKYLLGCIDVVSKYAWVQPLKNKNAETVTNAMEQILKSAKFRLPNKLYVDQGTEFHNTRFKSLMEDYNIHMYTTTTVLRHANIIERFWRTLKSYMFRYLYAKKTKTYINKLDEMIRAYNYRVHSSIAMRPVDVNYQNQKRVLDHLNRNNKSKVKPKFSVGDSVRVLVNKQRFEKGYSPNYSLEVFVIDRIKRHMKFPMYTLKDVQGDPIKGGFYEQQLQKVHSSHIYKIEKIIEEKTVGRGKRYLVKFVNHEKPEWIKGSNLFTLPTRR